MAFPMVFRVCLFLMMSIVFSVASNMEEMDQHDLQRRVWITQYVAYTSYIYETRTLIYTPPALSSGSNTVPAGNYAGNISFCNDPGFRVLITPNRTSCTTTICIRAKTWRDRNFTLFDLPDAPFLSQRIFPLATFNHWFHLNTGGLRYRFSSNPYQPPEEFACHSLPGVPTTRKNYTMYIADYYGTYCKETVQYPATLNSTCT